MANIKSQIKRNRQNLAAHERNKVVRSALKTDLKKVEAAIASGDKEAAEAAYAVASRSLDKAATKGVIHTNKAANKKSRLAKRLKAI